MGATVPSLIAFCSSNLCLSASLACLSTFPTVLVGIGGGVGVVGAVVGLACVNAAIGSAFPATGLACVNAAIGSGLPAACGAGVFPLSPMQQFLIVS